MITIPQTTMIPSPTQIMKFVCRNDNIAFPHFKLSYNAKIIIMVTKSAYYSKFDRMVQFMMLPLGSFYCLHLTCDKNEKNTHHILFFSSL